MLSYKDQIVLSDINPALNCFTSSENPIKLLKIEGLPYEIASKAAIEKPSE